MRPQELNRRAGQTLILFTLAVIPLFGMLGLVVDIGWTYYRKEVAKSAADAGANAAAIAAYAAAQGSGITCSTSGVTCYATDYTCPATMPTGTLDNINIGCLYAKENGFTNSGNQTVKFRSGVGAAPGNAGLTLGYWVIATVTESVPQSFSAVLGFPTANITAQSITGDENPEGGGGGCIFALDTTASGAVSLSGSSTLQSGCGVFDNSASTSALSVAGSSSITTTGGAVTRVVGSANSGTMSAVTPRPITGSPAIGDPWAAMPAPTYGACTDNNAGIRITGSSTQTINPGVICGGITVTSSSTLNLNPGMYVVKNGISISGSSRLSGNGVTIFLVSGSISAGGSSILVLTGPPSGTWMGVVFYQDRTNTNAATLTGSTNQAINGMIYIPSAALSYNGGSNTAPTSTTIVCKTLSLTGSSFIKTPAVTAFTPAMGGTVVVQ